MMASDSKTLTTLEGKLNERTLHRRGHLQTLFRHLLLHCIYDLCSASNSHIVARRVISNLNYTRIAAVTLLLLAATRKNIGRQSLN